jgi:hypothetical protein
LRSSFGRCPHLRIEIWGTRQLAYACEPRRRDSRYLAY